MPESRVVVPLSTSRTNGGVSATRRRRPVRLWRGTPASGRGEVAAPAAATTTRLRIVAAVRIARVLHRGGLTEFRGSAVSRRLQGEQLRVDAAVGDELLVAAL